MKRPRTIPKVTRTSNRTKNTNKKQITFIDSDTEDDDNGSIDNDNSSLDSDFSDDNEHVNKKVLLNDKKTVAKLPAPISRISKDYDAKAALSKKFKIPTMQTSGGQTNSVQPSSNGFGSRKSLGMRKRAGHLMRALYDHTTEDAVVLWNPDIDHIEEDLKITTDKPKKQKKSLADILGLKKEEKKLGHVVVDPVLGRVLRPHQVEGVKFLYQCTTGKVHSEAAG